MDTSSRLHRAIRVAAALLLLVVTPLASAQFKLLDDPWVSYDANRHAIRVGDLFDAGTICYRYDQLPQGKTVKTHRIVFRLDPVYTIRAYVLVTFSDRTFIEISEGSFDKVPCVAAAALAAKSDVATIAIDNDADAFDASCDGRWAVVVGANSATPVALVDLAAATQVATVPYAGKLARAAAVGDDNSSVLVVIDNPTNTDASAIRRLTIGAAGTLVDAGEELFLGSEYVIKVRVAPGSRIGVALTAAVPSRLVSFTIPGLRVVGSVTLGGSIGSGLDISPAGDRIYARSGRRGVVPDVVEGFGFDSATGAIGQVPLTVVSNVAAFSGVAYQDPLAISADGTVLVMTEEDVGQPPAGRVGVYSATTGAFVRALPQDAGARPLVVSTTSKCPNKAGVQLIEYYHAAFDHYFVTGIADEITLLDNGTLAGWSRTGERLNVHAPGTAGTAATCRFFSASFAPKSSHFYAPTASECATVKANPDWQFEGEVFNTAPTIDGTCPPPTLPLYRMYNNGQGGAPNHRYTTRQDVRAAMLASGWIPEGLGVGVVACVPP